MIRKHAKAHVNCETVQSEVEIINCHKGPLKYTGRGGEEAGVPNDVGGVKSDAS